MGQKEKELGQAVWKRKRERENSDNGLKKKKKRKLSRQFSQYLNLLCEASQ